MGQIQQESDILPITRVDTDQLVSFVEKMQVIGLRPSLQSTRHHIADLTKRHRHALFGGDEGDFFFGHVHGDGEFGQVDAIVPKASPQADTPQQSDYGNSRRNADGFTEGWNGEGKRNREGSRAKQYRREQGAEL